MQACPKCDYRRTLADQAKPASECPSCGVIYAKYVQRQAELDARQTKQSAQSSEASRGPRAALLLIVLLVLVAGAGYFAYTKYQEQQRQERRQLVESGLALLQGIQNKVTDADKLASSTGRAYLSGPVSKLQDIQREAEAVKVPACLGGAKNALADYVKAQVDTYLVFMQDTSYLMNPEYEKAQEASSRSAKHYKDFDPAEVCGRFIDRGPL
ncbi:hypothetical protein Mpe_B0640 (plasmid) [Methylibium petroleiphilum PM1]|uniref:Transmembrane protein n=1 Tax=Methylibium petroleiphilum (strain ATCC BAA-1232 / LMG 22953 / PM1) TaxID=420662 RepID=A2SPB5_METPP|nr:hypothetical protein Mpe_B0640 [Methylibium petroleiphilum PM1]